jgi:hypothetical protein
MTDVVPPIVISCCISQTISMDCMTGFLPVAQHSQAWRIFLDAAEESLVIVNCLQGNQNPKRMAPTDNVRDMTSCAATNQKEKNCGNCKVPGQTKTQCAETERERPKQKARKGVVSMRMYITMTC